MIFFIKRMNKVVKIAIFVSIFVFAIWYITGSHLNVYSCDDYWHGTNVRIYGFWEAQKYYWLNWEGSYTHTFIATLPHTIKSSYMPFLMNILSLTFLIFSFRQFFKTFLVRNAKNSTICACYIVSALLLCTSGKEEIRFWVCANTTYLFGISCLLLCLMHYNQEHNNKTFYIVDILLLGLLAGNKISFIFATFTLLTIHDLLYHRFLCKKYRMYIIVLATFSLINVLAPGNFIRLEENYAEAVVYPSFFESIFSRVSVMNNHLFSWLVLVPIVPYISRNIVRKDVIICLMGLFFVFMGDTMIMYICFHDSGPIRNNIIIELFFFITVIISMAYLYQNRKSTIHIVLLSILSITFNIALQTKPISQIKETYKYSKLARLRDQKVVNHKSSAPIQLDLLPNSGLLLSYFCNDEEWIKYVYLPYFGKHKDIDLR